MAKLKKNRHLKIVPPDGNGLPMDPDGELPLFGGSSVSRPLARINQLITEIRMIRDSQLDMAAEIDRLHKYQIKLIQALRGDSSPPPED